MDRVVLVFIVISQSDTWRWVLELCCCQFATEVKAHPGLRASLKEAICELPH
jgi:hypothetical protein